MPDTSILTPALLQSESDAQLLLLARQGNAQAFEALVRRHRPALVRYCRRILRDETHSEDVVQQGLMSAWNALIRGAEVREVQPWLYRIVRNGALRLARASRPDLEPLPLTLRGDDPPDEHLQQRMAVRQALGAVAELPQLQREALVLTAIDGYSNARAAQKLGTTDTAVRGLLYRARVHLRAACSAITPPWLVHWAATRNPSGERLAQTGIGGAGAGGVIALISKAGAVAVGAAAFALGTTGVSGPARGHSGHRAAAVARSRGASTTVGSSSVAGAGAGSLTPTSAVQSSIGPTPGDGTRGLSRIASNSPRYSVTHDGSPAHRGSDAAAIGSGGGDHGGDGSSSGGQDGSQSGSPIASSSGNGSGRGSSGDGGSSGSRHDSGGRGSGSGSPSSAGSSASSSNGSGPSQPSVSGGDGGGSGSRGSSPGGDGGNSAPSGSGADGVTSPSPTGSISEDAGSH